MNSSFSTRSVFAAFALCAVAACSPATPPADASVTDTGGGGGDAGGTLYSRLGNRAGIATAVDAIVAQELMDPEIASYFYFQVTPGSNGMPPVNGHPSVAQLKSCLVNQLANAAGGPEAYPGAPADNMGWQCRNMADSHRGLRIPGSVFDRFVMIAAGVLTTAGVSSADIAVIGGVLNSTRTAIVDPARDGGSFTPPTDASAGGG
jgi:hypothetical protein